MKRTRSFFKVLLITFVMSIMFISTIYADTVNEDVKDARNGVLQINVEYEDKDGNKAVLGGGTGFLINDENLITAYHVAHLAEDPEIYDEAVELFGNDFDPDKVTIKVVVKDDVYRTATIKLESEKYDFVVLELDKGISDREILPLFEGELSETEQVFALGFPDSVSIFQNENSYTSSDVTISDGRVTKTTESDGVKYVQHSASLSAGYSGGPLVNEDGAVVAVNRGTVSENNYSVAIEEIIYYLNTDKIDFDEVGGSNNNDDVVDDDKNDDKEDNKGDNDSVVNPEPDTTAKKPEATKEDKEKDEDAEEGLDTTLIIAIVAVVVVVLIIIIILIVTLGKGKKPDTRQGYQPPFPPVQNGGGMNNGGFNGGAPYGGMPTPPQPPVAPTNYSSEGAGATTVLSEGGDATTVLGVSAVSPVAITRVKTGERISITKPEFMIGKERRRVDYCISDNNSVSRVHVKVMNRGGQLFLMDMGATNGTFVNGTKLSTNQEVRLSSGDKFKLADEEFQV